MYKLEVMMLFHNWKDATIFMFSCSLGAMPSGKPLINHLGSATTASSGINPL